MSPLELVDDRFEQLARELRAAQPVAPEALRERLRALEPPARRQWEPNLRWAVPRVALVGLAALIGVAVVLGVVHQYSKSPQQNVVHGAMERGQSPHALKLAPVTPQPLHSRSSGADVPAVPGRLQQYDATLRVRVHDVDALSNATKRVMSDTRALGGYVASVAYATRAARRGGATLVLRVPIQRVQIAVERFSALGTILGQHVNVLDVTRRADRQAREIARLERDLARIEALLAPGGALSVDDVAKLRRQAEADRAALKTLRRKHRVLLRSARLARISVALTTPTPKAAASQGRFQKTLGDAGWVLVRELELLLYALVVVAPLVAIGGAAIALGRAQRRRSDVRLLERS